MKKLLGFVATLLVALSFSSIKTVNANSNDFLVSVLEINNQKNYANLDGITNFAIAKNYIYFVKEGKLFSFNQTNKQTSTLTHENVSNLKQAGEIVAFLSNNKLILLNADGTPFNLNSPEILANIFNIFKDAETTTIAYVNNAGLGVIKFNAQGEILDSSSGVDASNVNALAVTNKYTYLISENTSGRSTFVKLNNNVNFDRIEYPFVYLDCSNLEINPLTGTMLLTHNHNSALAVLSEQNGELIEQKNILIKASTTPSFALGDITNFTDVKIDNNQVLIADGRANANIQRFDLVNNNLVPREIVIASKSYEAGRFNNVSNIQITNSSNFVLSDTNNNRVQTITDNVVTSKLEVGEEKLINPKKIVTSDNINFYVLANEKIFIYNQTEQSVVATTTVNDISLDQNNQLFALCDDGVYKLDDKNQLTRVFEGDFAQGKILVANKFVIIYKNTEIKIYSPNFDKLIHSQTLTENVLDVNTDYYNNVYALSSSGFIRLNFNNQSDSFSLEVTTQNFGYDFSNISCFGLDKVNGNLVCFNNDLQALIKIENNFVKKIENFSNPVDPHNLNTFSSLISVGNVNLECYVYDYPLSTNFNFKLAKNTKVYILDSTTYSNDCFVMYNNNNKICFGYVNKNCLTITEQTQNEGVLVEPIYKTVKIYKYPTILKDVNNHGFVLATITQNQVLTCVNKQIVSFDNSNYYAVKLSDGNLGYVNLSDVRDVNTSDIKPLPNPNATIISGVEFVNLYKSEDANSQVLLELKQKSKFFVENYDAKTNFTYVTYVDEAKAVHSGYIETKYVVLENNNPNLVAAYVLLGVGIVLIIAGICVYVAYKKGKL